MKAGCGKLISPKRKICSCLPEHSAGGLTWDSKKSTQVPVKIAKLKKKSETATKKFTTTSASTTTSTTISTGKIFLYLNSKCSDC
jgi:hypothetical protein